MLTEKALAFATEAHGDQKRKYTGEPYINHPIAVAEIVKTVPEHNEHMIAAALLHDTVEDTDVTQYDIVREFGDIVGIFVAGLTDVSRPEDGNRARRKALDREHSARGLPPVQTIKLADLIDNSRSITEYDPDFAVVYMKEKKLLLEVMTKGDIGLYERAWSIVNDYYDRC